MLIELSIANFFSFREAQTFSMVASTKLQKKENTFTPEVEKEKLPKLLKVAAIYGPNASGKSNLIKALELVGKFAARLPTETEPLPVAPFRFDAALANQPSCITLHFVAKKVRYEFNLAATTERVTGEKLTAYPKGKEMLLYSREHTEQGEQYNFGEKLEGDDTLHTVWKNLTSPKMLFIAQAVANSSEEMKQLREPFEWLKGGLSIVEDDMGRWAKIAQMIAADIPELAKKLSAFLQEIDVPISSIRFDSPLANEPIGLASVNPNKTTEKPSKRTMLTHATALGEAEFDFKEESKGTQNLAGFWLPWMMKHSRILVADELDSSLHPNIVAALIKKHIEAEQPSQLIFTTHDTHLMDTKLMRRDQFWLTERDMNGATQLRSIHQFEGRESEDLEKRYYEGRYRALPFVR
ncbi:MAG: ATP-binding protein [Sideroxydans sp.]|nr:ATP-binding protein [Sideroxydans sp.]